MQYIVLDTKWPLLKNDVIYDTDNSPSYGAIPFDSLLHEKGG